MIDYELRKAESLEEGCKNLYEIIKLLRSPEGCPWDRVQTNKSATESMIDEAYEYLDGAIRKDVSSMREEIGDVLINAFMNLYINEEHGDFKAEEALNEVCEKLIRRHPHVFSNMHAENEAEGLSLWNSIKENVEGHKEKSEDFFSHIPASIPPLEEAYEIQKKLRKVGFDWEDTEGVISKIKEELSEVEEAIRENDADHTEEEIGDLLFSVVNLARYLSLRPNTAMMRANRKVRARFQKLFDLARIRNIPIDKNHVDQMNDLWEEIKAKEKMATDS